MHWIDPVVAIIIALIFGALLVGGLGWRHPRQPRVGPSLLFLLLLLFPLMWAASVWMTPAGPMMMGTAFVPVLLAGLLIALLIAGLATPQPKTARDVRVEAAEADAAATAFGVVFWILIVLAIGAIIAGYLV